jgi:hypothetical protein
VFIYSSLLLWIGGFVYSKMEHKFNISNLALIITIFIIASMLSFRLAFEFFQTGGSCIGCLPGSTCCTCSTILSFGGSLPCCSMPGRAGALFGVISAGDIPAKFIGYSLALFTVEYIGTINLLWAGIFCMLASIPFL